MLYHVKPNTWPALSAIGVVFNDTFNRASPGSNYDATNASGVTFSQNGSFLRAARATVGGFTDYIQLLWPSSTQGFTSEIMTIKLRYRVVTGTVGLSLGWRSISGNSVVNATGIAVSGASGYASFYHNGTEQTPRSSVQALSNGDQAEIEMNRVNSVTFTVITRKLDGSGNTVSSQTKTYNFGTTIGSLLQVNVSQFAIYFNGGTYDLEDLTVTHGLSKYAKIGFVGDSITQFYSASSTAASYPRKTMATSTFPFVVLAGQGQRTAEILANLDEIIIVRPHHVIMMIGTNDIGTGVSSATWQANYQAIVSALQAAAIHVILCYLVPRNSYDFRPTTVGSPNKWIADTYGSDPHVTVIDTYTDLKDPSGNGINATYSGDGVHPNSTGMTVVADKIKASIPIRLGI